MKWLISATAALSIIVAGCQSRETPVRAVVQETPPPYDLQFLDTMTMHHRHGIEMARIGREKGRSDALTTLAGVMFVHLQEETERMSALRDRWYPSAADARNTELPGAALMRSMDMSLMTDPSGKDFDIAFVESMVPHHQGAIAMARDAMEKAEHPEVRALAREILEREQREIEMLERWKQRWQR